MSSPKTNEIALAGRKQSRREVARLAHDHNQVAMLEFQSPTAALIAAPVPVVARALTLILASMLVCLILLLGLVRVDQVVTAGGVVISTAPTIVLQPFESSIVRSVNVREGDIVHKGQIVATLDPTLSAGDEKSTTAQEASLTAEVARLRAELDGRPYLSDGTGYGNAMALMYQQRTQQYEYHVDGLQQKIGSTRAKLDQANADARLASDRLVGLRDAEARRVELERLQVGSHLNTLSARDSRLQMEATLSDAQNAARGAQRDLNAAISDLADYIHQWHSETSQQLTTQERSLSDMRGQASRNTLRHSLVELRAASDGVVLSVAKVSVGSVMQSGDEFIKLVPADAPLEVEAQINGTEAGFVQVGDPATIKFDTLPYMLYGTAEGHVSYISPDSFTQPTQAAGLQRPLTDPAASSPNGLPYYRGRLTIDRMKLVNVPRSFRLTPGMPVTGDVKVGERSILQYMLARVAPTFTEGMREP